MFELDEIVSEFIVESCESLDMVDRKLIELEQTPGEVSILACIFRSIHSIKGTSGFLGFETLGSVAHVGENLLSKLRDGELAVTEEITSALLALVDALRSMLGEIEATGKDLSNDYSDLIAELTRLQSPTSSLEPNNSIDNIDAQINAALEAAAANAKPKVSASTTPAVSSKTQISSGASNSDTTVSSKTTEQENKTTSEKEIKGPQAAENNIRVDVSLLDQLMNLVGELVLTRNQILQFTNAFENPVLQSTTQRLNHITTELQERVMKTRMQPVGNVWSKFPRIVRDLSVSCGKQVRVQMEGADTELDKTIIEAIKDPLTHIIRNSVDHGIETPDIRVARGKAPEGILSLRAFHESGQVVIEISDDGGGIDGKKIKSKAVDKKLITQDQADKMSERDAINLIFLPGFSTAEKVSNISGRGVGMDVVKTNIESIGGLVDIQSTVGGGSTIRIRIPLTLAIIPALTVRCGNSKFAIPQVSLLELLCIEPGSSQNYSIEWIQGVPVCRLRGKLLPLVSLGTELRLRKADEIFGGPVNIIVLQADDRQFGLIVDEIQDTGEIVVKPLNKCLKNLPVYAGATILGDGNVALILDVMQLAQRARVVNDNHNTIVTDHDDHSNANRCDTETLLVFDAANGVSCAVPISSLARLEEVPRTKLERSGGNLALQYREQILPLVDLNQALGGGYSSCGFESDEENTNVHILVYGQNENCIGLMVNRIADIVHAEIKVKQESNRSGVAYTSVIQGRITDVLDVCELIQAIAPEYSATACTL